MRLYELARELNYSLLEINSRKKEVGLLNGYGFSFVPDKVADKIRDAFPKKEENPCLKREKPKVKRPPRKKPAKPKKETKPKEAEVIVSIEEGSFVQEGGPIVAEAASDLAAESTVEIETPMEEVAANFEESVAVAENVEAKVAAAPASAGEEKKAAVEAKKPAEKKAAKKEEVGILGRLQTDEDTQFEVGRIVSQAPAAKAPKKKKKRNFTNERESDWNLRQGKIITPQPLPKKNQHETKGTKLQRMQLVYGHELPTKERHRAESTKREKSEEKNVITLPINLRDLSEKLGIKATDVIKFLMTQGVFVTITDVVDLEMAENIAAHFKKDVLFEEGKSEEEVIQDIVQVNESANLTSRPPVITIMGHVDHGKTSLLDRIRSSNLTEGETGGITQHIGGYQVVKDDYTLTFLDTPGHAAFTSMRARGANVTDIVVLVVAANDGMMPQTEEAVNHAKAAGVPIIVAVNKMDLEDADPNRVKEQLATLELIPEEWSGSTPYIPVSALTGEGIGDLLEMINLQSEMLELKADYDLLGDGVVIEAHMETGRGVVASILVRSGFFKKGDPILCGTGYGWLRQLEDENGKVLKEAGPSKIVKVTGLSECPSPGDQINTMPSIKKAKELSEDRKAKQRVSQLEDKQAMTMDSLMDQLTSAECKDTNILIKGDVQGSIEALEQALSELGNEEVKIKLIHKGVGAVTESDILLAKASDAKVVAFRVGADSKAKKASVSESVEIKNYSIIYDLLNDMRDLLEGMLEPDKIENVVGEIEVRQVFRITNVGMIAGCYIKSGYAERNMPIRLLRDGVVIYTGKIAALKRFKDDVKRVETRYECGIRLENYDDIRVDDILEPYTVEMIQKKLDSN